MFSLKTSASWFLIPRMFNVIKSCNSPRKASLRKKVATLSVSLPNNPNFLIEQHIPRQLTRIISNAIEIRIAQAYFVISRDIQSRKDSPKSKKTPNMEDDWRPTFSLKMSLFAYSNPDSIFFVRIRQCTVWISALFTSLAALPYIVPRWKGSLFGKRLFPSDEDFMTETCCLIISYSPGFCDLYFPAM